jgi:dihydrofolate reductase
VARRVEKIVFSSTLTDAPWQNSRIADADPATIVQQLRTQPGGDIVALNSGSIINALLEAGELVRLVLNLCPEISGGGAHLFADSLLRPPGRSRTCRPLIRARST